MPSQTAPQLTVVVCTLDEQQVIDRCLASVRWADELLILDSGSTDATRAHAERHGARVIDQPWLGFSAQKNAGARLARHDWILSLDADEVVTPELAQSIRAALARRPAASDAFAVDRRSDFLGALLPNNARRSKRHSLVRLYNRRHAEWDETMSVHEVVRCSGSVRRLRGALLHWNEYSLDELFSLFNRYATVEAAELRRRGRRSPAIALVVWPLLRFAWHYVARGEFRLGTRGLVHAGLKATSDFMRYAKLWEADLEPLAPPDALHAERATERGAALGTAGGGRRASSAR